MQQNKRNLFITLTLLILTSALFRIVPGRPFGFEPMIAMAIFGGAVLQNKKLGFALPLFAMLISDSLFQLLTVKGYVNMPGFYEGQWLNYLLLAGITFFGIFMKRITVANVAIAAIAAPTVYFLLSNTGVWAMHGGWQRPITGAGYIQALADGLPFYKMSLISTAFFSAALFSLHAILKSSQAKRVAVA